MDTVPESLFIQTKITPRIWGVTRHHKASEAKYVIWVIGDSYLLITIREGVDNMMVSLNIDHHQRYYLVMTF